MVDRWLPLWILAAGCGGAPEAVPEAAPEPTEQAKTPSEKGSAQRVVTIGAAITEIALQLDRDAVVGIDSASAQRAEGLPAVGHSRQVSAEGVLSLEPTLVLITDTAGPEEVIAQLKTAVTVKELSHERSVEGVGKLVDAVAETLQADPAPVKDAFTTSCADLPKGDRHGSALFVYARGGGTMNVSGTGTAAAAMLDLAGLDNAVTGYEGYKPLTPEAAVAANPDFVVFTEHGLEGLGGKEALAEVPGLALLDAVKNGKVAAVNDFDLLAFGLGTCKGASALAKATSR